MSKMITYAGVSRTAGKLKFRVATDDKRMAQLVKLGDTDVEMSKIYNYAETKADAAKELLTRNFANGRAEIQALLESVAGKVSAPRKAREVQVKAKKVEVKENTLSIAEANARAVASMREITPERALELLCNRVTKKRRSRKTVEVV